MKFVQEIPGEPRAAHSYDAKRKNGYRLQFSQSSTRPDWQTSRRAWYLEMTSWSVDIDCPTRVYIAYIVVPRCGSGKCCLERYKMLLSTYAAAMVKFGTSARATTGAIAYAMGKQQCHSTAFPG
ncbi:hypothetical protein VTP01DRAFT_2428 [Rhizomucor pusillus]|uniref:uncharacterized protein n=1 Tax=Rhizomucor pusillus TaxID=4840 RepID=UPI003742E364